MTERTPENPEDPAQAAVEAPRETIRPPGLMYVLTGLICACALFTVSFNATCQSDGCIGVFLPLAATWILTAVQLLVALPIYMVRCMKLDANMARAAAVAILVSLGAAVLAAIVVFR